MKAEGCGERTACQRGGLCGEDLGDDRAGYDAVVLAAEA